MDMDFTTTISPNFQIPEGYRRVFIFEDSSTKFPFRHVMVIDSAGIHVTEQGRASKGTNVACMDYIDVQIKSVREELGV